MYSKGDVNLFNNRKWLLGCFIMLIALLICPLGLAATGSETIGNVRVQILSSTLVRLEVKGPNGFEDRTTFHITNRNWPGATYTRTTSGSTVLIQTADYIVRVPSSATSLSGITITKTDGTQIWAYSSLPANDRAWLPGITDNSWAWAIADNPRMVPASWGYNIAASGVPNYSTNGWDLTNNAPDMYVFLPKGNVRTLRTDLINLTGRSELIPLYALGYWDSRYYAYTEQTALQQIDDYRNRDLPIDILVIDTDWRVGGSTGYDINTSLFPDMTRFINSAHAKNVRIMFNDHPEPRANSLDPTEVTFRNNGLRGLLNKGLDFWWFDRNWGVSYNSPASNLQKEIWGMYVYHWIMNDYYPNRRPIIMANCDGIDNGTRNNPPSFVTHRYTVQWTGDIYPDFASLQREVDNAVYNGMYAAFPYTSADLGGHTQSNPTTEGYIRWLQYGSLSPITRPHCTNYLAGRMPWLFGDTALNITRKFVKMRYRLLPLLYTLARNSYDTGDPILRRCDFDYPTYTEARGNTQYLLGDGILVAPVIASGTSRSLWIPPGTWIDVWSGSTITGPQTITATVPLEKMPIYIKAGTIVPLAPDMSYIGQKPWDPITLDVYPTGSKTASVNMYEDDGISKDYKNGSYRTTQFTSTVDTANKKVTVTINPAQGTYSGASANRSWVVRVHRPVEWTYMTAVSATINGASATFAEKGKDSTAMPFVNSGGSPDTNVIEVTVPSAAVSSTRTVVVNFTEGATPTPGPTATPIPTTVYEAENATLASGAAVATDHTGYSGSGFVAGYWNTGATTTFTVNAPNSNTYNVTLRYANATGSAKTVSLYVNSTKVKQITLANLANWDTWSNQTESVSLNAGNNTIAYKYDTTDTGNINLDYIVLNTGSATPTPTPASTPTPTPTPSSGVIFYQNADYGGTASQVFAKGNYTLSQLQAKGCSNDWMSSLKVPSGWTVIVYQDNNFLGTSWTFTADTSYVGSACNDKMSSCKIQ